MLAPFVFLGHSQCYTRPFSRAAMHCPLCGEHSPKLFHQDRRREYWQCQRCALVFVPPEQYLSAEQEKAIYDLHQNDCTDAGYLQFLSRVSEPLQALLSKLASGLDFGCGPAPALAQLFQTQGHQMTVFDPFFANQPDVLQRTYDFVTCTEAIEHFHQPGREWQTLLSLVKPDGLLAIMTKKVIDQTRFAHWHYKNDLTHVVFFSDATFDYLAKRDQLSVCHRSADVIIFRKDAI